MRFFHPSSTIACFALASSALAAPDGFRPLFNGSDLTGWDGNPELWSVEDGVITGRTKDDGQISYNQFLIWRGGELENFEVRAKVKVVGNNSGIQYRSKELPENGKWSVGGYQCDIHPNAPYNAMLYEERGRGIIAENGQDVVITPETERWLTATREPVKADPAEWHEYSITAIGSHIEHKIDGKLTMSLDDFDPEAGARKGLLAFQLHQGPAMTVEIKDIMLRELPAGAGAAFDRAAIPANAKHIGGKKPEPAPETSALPLPQISVPDGFEIELIYTVPREDQGSWVTLCKDDKGRLIAGDQYGSIYRFAAPAPGAKLQKADIEKIDLDIGHAWGMCYAFDALYVVVNDDAHGGRGLYRIKDTNGDDTFDEVSLLKKFQESGGEHGPHAVIPGPDGKSLYIACGNQTALPENYDRSRVSEVWGEDNLIPRVYGRGFMKGVEAPRGWVCKTDPEGKEWEVVATGFRNQYDIDFAPNGELFTYDADMEWDLNTPWYRPTRINHVISGAEFGWRNGSAKWPDYYSDSFGAVADIGPGSPTGVIFGTGTKFPAKYQKAFFAADWSYGKLYAVHLEPKGSTYSATFEEFAAGQPFPLTDLAVGDDGALYAAVGGRRVQSRVYRISYAGDESTAPATWKDANSDQLAARHALESYHLQPSPLALRKAWNHLGSEDRAMRFAARTALEKLPVDQWAKRALREKDPFAMLGAIISLARTGNSSHQAGVVRALLSLDYADLDLQERFDLLRAYGLTFIRLGAPDDAQRAAVTAQINSHFPADNRAENIELSTVLSYLSAPEIVARSVALMENAPTQEEQIAVAKNIRHQETGWTPELQERYFKWFVRAAHYKGGAGFGKFIEEIKADAVAKLDGEQKKSLEPILDSVEKPEGPVRTTKPRQYVKNWTMDDLTPLLASGLEGGRDFENGRDSFGAATCFACHRFNNEGGAIGPDLTSAAGKFSPRDLLEQIIDPGKEISDQYGSMIFNMNDGSMITGRIANLNEDQYMVITDLFNPGEMASVDSKNVESVEPSPVSMMPPGLINILTDEDILDLMAYILSQGDPEDPLFEN